MHQSSSGRESVGSHDTGIDLNPDDVPVGYHPSVDRLSSHRRRSRSVAASRSAAADSLPRVIDADDEDDDPSVAGSRRSTSRSASFDKTMEWLMTCTESKCPPGQFADPCSADLSHLHDAQGFDGAAAAADIAGNAECSEMSAPQDPQCKPDNQSRSSSPARSLSQPPFESGAGDDEARVAVLSDSLNAGLRHRRAADGSVTAADHVVTSNSADLRHRLEEQGSRQTLLSSVDSETGVRSRRWSKQKVLLTIFYFTRFFFQLSCKHALFHDHRLS